MAVNVRVACEPAGVIAGQPRRIFNGSTEKGAVRLV